MSFGKGSHFDKRNAKDKKKDSVQLPLLSLSLSLNVIQRVYRSHSKPLLPLLQCTASQASLTMTSFPPWSASVLPVGPPFLLVEGLFRPSPLLLVPSPSFFRQRRCPPSRRICTAEPPFATLRVPTAQATPSKMSSPVTLRLFFFFFSSSYLDLDDSFSYNKKMGHFTPNPSVHFFFTFSPSPSIMMGDDTNTTPKTTTRLIDSDLAVALVFQQQHYHHAFDLTSITAILVLYGLPRLKKRGCNRNMKKGYTAPDEEQSPKNLKLLSCFAHANCQLGDWCLLPSSAYSSSISMEKGMSKLELNDSIYNELDSNPTGSGCHSEEAAVEKFNGNKNAMNLEIRSRGNVVGKLVRTKHHKEITFPLVINSSESKPIRFKKNSCTYG
ncbi:hypothetical protein Ahy_B04g069555 isoform C [Arachis hypogaea]|uniref:Uncharacterized protein n=1 Tax=Arachis hypogaea TaxID=3818 RepID=A0A444ZCZ6_ARAHY|nr:hypothetical protein Ahy_B04g069555 isoform C [Arachis hypogaea]